MSRLEQMKRLCEGLEAFSNVRQGFPEYNTFFADGAALVFDAIDLPASFQTADEDEQRRILSVALSQVEAAIASQPNAVVSLGLLCEVKQLVLDIEQWRRDAEDTLSQRCFEEMETRESIFEKFRAADVFAQQYEKARQLQQEARRLVLLLKAAVSHEGVEPSERHSGSSIDEPPIDKLVETRVLRAFMKIWKARKSHALAGQAMARKLTEDDWKAYVSSRPGRKIRLAPEAYFTNLSQDWARDESLIPQTLK